MCLATLATLCACDLVKPGDVVNPNVTDDDFNGSPESMATWTNGTEMKFATGLGYWCQMVEILSDNYFNNYSRSSNVFDIPRILYTDDDVTSMQRAIGTMRQMADYGLTTVAQGDKPTEAQLFRLYVIKAYSYLLGGEAFTGLPLTEGGDIHPWQEHLQQALQTLDEAARHAATADDRAFISTLKARAYYALGDREHAVAMAEKSLGESADFVSQVTFDGASNVINETQQAVWLTWFQPLPRLDFLDPKYFQTRADEQRPITIGKAEENYLILAEAHVSQQKLDAAKADLKGLLALVRKRPVQENVNDTLEKRINGMYKSYPNDARFKVRASAADPARAGLIIDRQSPHRITVPYISGTSVTEQMIDGLQSLDDALEMVYLMRQEIFICEGRRITDLGIRLPVCEVEAAHASNGAQYIEVQMPSFIPLNLEMDAFDVDSTTMTITCHYNMNRVIADHKSSPMVAPFE